MVVGQVVSVARMSVRRLAMVKHSQHLSAELDA